MHKVNYVSHGSLTALELDNSSVNLMIIDKVFLGYFGGFKISVLLVHYFVNLISLTLYCSKYGNMQKGHKHSEASPICDRFVFNKVKNIFFDTPPIFDMSLRFTKILIHIFCPFGVLDQVKEGLGGNVRLILSGAAPLATHVEAFLRVVACAHVLQGYGV